MRAASALALVMILGAVTSAGAQSNRPDSNGPQASNRADRLYFATLKRQVDAEQVRRDTVVRDLQMRLMPGQVNTRSCDRMRAAESADPQLLERIERLCAPRPAAAAKPKAPEAQPSQVTAAE